MHVPPGQLDSNRARQLVQVAAHGSASHIMVVNPGNVLPL
jgi:hypothetical protein